MTMLARRALTNMLMVLATFYDDADVDAHDESDDGPAHGRPAGGQVVEAVLQSGHHQRGVAVHVVTGEVETLKGKRRV